MIAAAARLRETEDFEPGRGGVSEALKELEHLSQVLNEIREGNAPAAAEILDDLIFGKVLRQLH